MVKMLAEKGKEIFHFVPFLKFLSVILEDIFTFFLWRLNNPFSKTLYWYYFFLPAGYLQDHENSYCTLEKSCQQEDDTLTPEVTPEPPRYASQCRWASLSGLDRDTLTFPGGSSIQLHTVPPALLQRIPLFYVCTRCGKVFWEGSHFDRVRSMFQEVLRITDEDSVSTEAHLKAALQS